MGDSGNRCGCDQMLATMDLCVKKRIPEISHLNLRVDNGESYVLLSSGDTTIHHLINIFLGLETGYAGTVEIDHIDVRADRSYHQKNMVYLDGGSHWRLDLRIGSMIDFLRRSMSIPEDEFEDLLIKLNLESIYKKRINEIEAVEWRRILLALVQLKKTSNYIFRDFARGMPLDFNIEFNQRLQQMKKKGCAIFYLSDDVFLAPEIGDRIGFMKRGKLLLELSASKMKKMSSRELYFQFLAER